MLWSPKLRKSITIFSISKFHMQFILIRKMDQKIIGFEKTFGEDSDTATDNLVSENLKHRNIKSSHPKSIFQHTGVETTYFGRSELVDAPLFFGQSWSLLLDQYWRPVLKRANAHILLLSQHTCEACGQPLPQGKPSNA